MNRSLSKEQAQVLFEEHSSYIFRIALMMTHSSIMADDITQEVFVLIFRKYHLYDATRPIRPWMATITINVIRAHYRKRKWQLLLGVLPDKASEEYVDHLVIQREERHELWEMVSRLSFKQRSVIVLHYYAGLSLVEVGETLGIPTGTCKSRLHDALRRLRVYYEHDERMDKGALPSEHEKNTYINPKAKKGDL